MSRRDFKISDLILDDEDEARDPADYGARVLALTPAQQARVMDLIDLFGPERVSVCRPCARGSVVLEYPTGKMHSTVYRERLGPDAQPTERESGYELRRR